MKTEINIQNLKEQFNLDYSEIQQISDDSETGFIRLIGYLADYPIYRDRKWYLFAETITINPTTQKIYRIDKTTSKNQDWIIDNSYKVIVTQGGVPVLNTDFITERTESVNVGTEEEPIWEDQTVSVPISLENSPFLLADAFDFYYGIRHSRDANMSMAELWEAAVAGDDMWGYFDQKYEHYSLLDVINIIWNQMQ